MLISLVLTSDTVCPFIVLFHSENAYQLILKGNNPLEDYSYFRGLPGPPDHQPCPIGGGDIPFFPCQKVSKAMFLLKQIWVCPTQLLFSR